MAVAAFPLIVSVLEADRKASAIYEATILALLAQVGCER